jgi:3-phosphoshikimate 1-carboxyvinyltransferase
MTFAKPKPASAPRAVACLHRRNGAPFSARIPGSKSYTNRALVLAAMRPGTTTIAGGLDCDDTQRLAAALASFDGLAVEPLEGGFRVRRSEGVLGAPAAEVHMGAAGTPARFLLAFAAAARGATVVTGTPRLCERPMSDLLATLRSLGIRCECLGREGCLPVRVHGGQPSARTWRIRGDVSSQFTSALLLLASQQEGTQPITIQIEGHQVSRPYVEMTRALMKACGIAAERAGEDAIVVTPARASVARIPVEVDASGMSYFLAAAAVTGTTVEIPGIGGGSAQGDVGLVRAFERMGCEVALGEGSIRLAGRELVGIEIDMETMPDTVLTLAAVAARARGSTRITNIANLRVKECDRIHAAAAELQRLGVAVEEGPDFLVIRPDGVLQGARIHTYDDHRVAMAFAVLGLVQPGISIEDPECVGKSFPGFWQELARFVRHHEGGF